MQWQADSGRTGEAGCCAADVEGWVDAAEAAEAACAPAQSASCACVRGLRIDARIGGESCGACAWLPGWRGREGGW